MQKLRQKQQEDELLRTFRAIDESTKAVILRFAQGQAKKAAAKEPKLTVILGGKSFALNSSTPQAIAHKI